MSRIDVLEFKKYLPARALTALKPYYRRFFPNQVIALINPTWRCNYRCSYCPIVTKFAYTTVVDKSGERNGEDWVEALERLPAAAVYMAGGEPFVYQDIATLINRMPRKHHILGIVTNLSQPVSVYRKIKKRIKLIASLHREHIEPEPFVAKIKELSDQFEIHVNIVATPENLLHLDMISSELKVKGVTLHVDPFIDVVAGFHYTSEQLEILGRHVHFDRKVKSQMDYGDYTPKLCSAGRNYFTVSPDGSAYTCYGGMHFNHSSQYTQIVADRDVSKYRMGNIFNPEFRLNREDIICSMPCNAACDRDSVLIRPAQIKSASEKPVARVQGTGQAR
jgi:MoaA/NifB/PqqE/SkfB family radical SAM enzyme